MIPIQEIKNIIYSIFSDSGYVIKNFNVQFPHPLDIKIIKDKENNISLDFTKSLPKVGWKKIINFTAWVQGISLGQTEGVLKLKYFPDIKFSYDDSTPKLFGNMYDFTDIENDIEKEYGNDERKKLAKKCLHYANEWATIASQSGLNFSACNTKSKKQLKKSCKQFVVDNIKNDKEIVAGSIILTFLLLYVVLPVVLKFILERIFKKLFN